MDEFRIPCPECGKRLKVRDRSLLGRKVKCPKCENRFVLALPEEEDDDLVEFEMANAAPAAGTSARWIPDDATEAAPSPSPVGTIERPAPFEEGPASEPFVGEEGGVARMRELRRRNAKRRNAAIVFGVVTAIAIGGTWAAISSYQAGKEAERLAEEARKKEEAAPTADRLYAKGQKALEHNLALAEEHDPTEGDEIDMKYLPGGASMVFHIRPKEIHESISGKEVLKAIGPVKQWFDGWLQAHIGTFPLEQVEELTVAVYAHSKVEDPTVAAVFRFSGPLQRSDLIKAISGDKISDLPEIYVNSEHAYMVQEDNRCLAICDNDEDTIADLKDSTGVPLAAYAPVESMILETDRRRHFTAVFRPGDLVTFRDQLFDPSLVPLATHLVDWLGGTEIDSAVWSVHLERRLYSDLKLKPLTTANGVFTKPSILHRDIRDNYDGLAIRLYTMAKGYMNPKTVGRRKLIGRFPAMMKAYALGTLGGASDGYLQMTTVIDNQNAAPNIAAAAIYTWDEARGTDFSKKVEVPTDTGPVLVAERLKQTNMEATFPNMPLQEVLDFVAGESRTEIVIDGDALKDAGLTKNMRQKIEFGTASGMDVLKAIVDAYQSPTAKMCIIVDEQAKRVTLTTVKFAKQRGETPYAF